MALDFASAMQKKAMLDAAADAAALAAVTPAMMTQSDQAVDDGRAKHVRGAGFDHSGIELQRADRHRYRQPAYAHRHRHYTASSINQFAGILGMPNWPISSRIRQRRNGSPPQAMNTAAPNINFYLLLDNSPSMDLPATSAGITAMINATKNAPSNGGNAGGCAFACHESDPAADNLGNPGGIDNYQLAQNLGVVTRIQNMASATQSLMTTAASTEAANNATYEVAIYTFDPSGSTSGNTSQRPLHGSATDIEFDDCARRRQATSTCWRCTPTTTSRARLTTTTRIPIFELRHVADQRHHAEPGDRRCEQHAARSAVHRHRRRRGRDRSAAAAKTTVSTSIGTRCQQPFDTTWCTTVKNRGILIAVLYTEYLPLPASGTGSNSWYNSYVAPYQSQIGPNLQNCASSNLFFSVTTDGDITAAMQTLFQRR